MKRKFCTLRLEITREQTAAGVNEFVYILMLYTLETRLTHPVWQANVKSRLHHSYMYIEQLLQSNRTLTTKYLFCKMRLKQSLTKVR